MIVQKHVSFLTTNDKQHFLTSVGEDEEEQYQCHVPLDLHQTCQLENRNYSMMQSIDN